MTLHNKITAIIPAFNEEKTIGSVINGVKNYVSEIIVVDDVSSDNTAVNAKNAGAIVVSHKENKGYDASLQDGFSEAMKREANVSVTFDADGQHNPEDIKKLADLIISGQADIAIGQRQKLTHPGERIFSWYTNYFFGIKDPLCGLKAYSKKVYEAIGYFDTIGSIGTQLMIQAIARGFIVKTIPIEVKERKDVSRFYTKRLKANYKILKALLKLIILKKNGYIRYNSLGRGER